MQKPASPPNKRALSRPVVTPLVSRRQRRVLAPVVLVTIAEISHPQSVPIIPLALPHEFVCDSRVFLARAPTLHLEGKQPDLAIGKIGQNVIEVRDRAFLLVEQ